MFSPREYQRAYWLANKEALKEKYKRYRAQNKEKLNEYSREYRKTHIEEERARNKKWYYLNRNNPRVRLENSCRSRVRQAIRRVSGTKAGRTLALIGCTVPELRAHLEKKFRPGMTWENYGPEWHVDHIKPCASFDLTDREQQKICFHYSNLQPLFARENIQKGSR